MGGDCKKTFEFYDIMGYEVLDPKFQLLYDNM